MTNKFILIMNDFHSLFLSAIALFGVIMFATSINMSEYSDGDSSKSIDFVHKIKGIKDNGHFPSGN